MATWVGDRSRTSGRSCSTRAPITPSRMASRSARAAGHSHRHLGPDDYLSLRHPRRLAARRPRARAATSARHFRRPPAGATRRALHRHPGPRLDFDHRPGRAAVLRMFGQLRESAEQQLWPDFRRTATTDWLGPLEDGLRSIGRPELATLVLAVLRGLLMDLDATADTTRTDRAFHDFLDAVEQLSSGDRATAGRFQERASSGTTSSVTAWDM